MNTPAKRQCGDCQLCCKLLPVVELSKPANHRCDFQKRGVGCTIYSTRPPACRNWHCRWRLSDDTADLSRPDRSGYVIDVMPDYVTLQDDLTGKTMHWPCLQIWVDPARPDAWRTDKNLRAYIERQGKSQGLIALMRTGDPATTIIVAPPSVNGGEWAYRTTQAEEAEHSVEQLAQLFNVEMTLAEEV